MAGKSGFGSLIWWKGGRGVAEVRNRAVGVFREVLRCLPIPLSIQILPYPARKSLRIKCIPIITTDSSGYAINME